MFERLKVLYQENKINDSGLDNAVAKGWIIQTQADEIKRANI